MPVSRDGSDKAEIALNGKILEKVKIFKHIGGILENGRKHTEDVKIKTNGGLQTIGRMRTLQRNKNLTMNKSNFIWIGKLGTKQIRLKRQSCNQGTKMTQE